MLTSLSIKPSGQCPPMIWGEILLPVTRNRFLWMAMVIRAWKQPTRCSTRGGLLIWAGIMKSLTSKCRVKHLLWAWMVSRKNACMLPHLGLVSHSNNLIPRVIYLVLAPVPLSIFRSNSKFDENSERSSVKYTRPITTIFCTRHDSVTVVTCAKYRCDRSNICETRALWIFIEFRIRSKYA